MLEPHIPIHIQNYSDKEAQSCLEYFIDRKWIMKQEGQYLGQVIILRALQIFEHQIIQLCSVPVPIGN